jgi:processive 1,2-diacylglycerol beta-glucosyltransferase
MSLRLLILTAGFGEGHNAAARALAAAADRIAGTGAAEVVDVFALTSPRLNAVSRRLYLDVINDAPRVWSAVYNAVDRHDLVRRGMFFFRREIAMLAELLRVQHPVAVCSTYPVYAFLLEKIARDGGPLVPHFNVVTDSISIHSLWWRAGAHGWFLPNDDSARILLDAGVDPALVHVSGFPVPSFFSRNASRLSPPVLANGSAPRILHIINSGTRHAAATARKLLTETDWEITLAVGRDEKLRRQLELLAAARPHATTILGWTDQIPHLLMTHHVVVSKAGGATTQEAIAALCPMIVSQVVPGQEEGNYELLRRHGAGALAETPDAVLAELRRAFADDGRVWREWRAALKPLARSDAADDIVRHILASTHDDTGFAFPNLNDSEIAAAARRAPRA